MEGDGGSLFQAIVCPQTEIQTLLQLPQRNIGCLVLLLLIKALLNINSAPSPVHMTGSWGVRGFVAIKIQINVYSVELSKRGIFREKKIVFSSRLNT